MNKEQQIEEFQNDIIDNLFDGGTYKLAEALYNAGYRKVPEYAVILTPEEREEEIKSTNEILVELPCKCIEELDIIKGGMIFIFYKMCLEQNLRQGVFLEYKSKINEWFKSYLKNKGLQEKGK